MYKFRSRRKKTFLQRYGSAIAFTAIGGASVSFGFLVPAVSGTDAQQRVFSEGLSIELDRTSPAYAALEDAWVSGESAPARLSPHPAQSLELLAGGTTSAPLAARIARDNLREETLYRHEFAAREANSKAMAQAAADILRNMTSHFEKPAEPEAVAVVEKPVVAPSVVEHVPAKNVRAISLTDLHMSREELLGSLFLPIAKSMPAPGGALPIRGLANANGGYTNTNNGVAGLGRGLRVISARHHYDPDYVPPAPPQNAAASRAFGVQRSKAAVFGTESQTPEYLPALPGRDGSTRAPASDQRADQQNAVSPPPLHQIVLSGTVELTDGLALSNSLDRVVVYRESEGETQEAGAVWLREGRYEIFVEEAVGSIIGEVRTPYGDVVGRGVVDLSQLGATGAKTQSQHQISGIALRLHPVVQGFGGHVMSMRTEEQNPHLKGAEVNFPDLALTTTTEKGGGFNLPHLVDGSIAIAKVRHAGFWGALAFVHAGADNQIQLIPDQAGQFLAQVLEHLRASDPSQTKKAFVWGRVMKNGRPVANAHVELADADDAPTPVYFDARLRPDLSARGTSENGFFAFYPVAPGTQAARVTTDDGPTAEPILFLAAEGMTSRMDLEMGADKNVKVRVFDAFKTDQPLGALLALTGGTTIMPVNGGTTSLRVAKSAAPLIVDADAGAIYLRERVTSDRERSSLYVPMVQKVWLERMQGTMHFNPSADLGTIVGFVAGASAFKVSAGEAKILYFNANGEPSAAEFGEPGGGYVILNAAPGFQTVTVQDSGSTKISSIVTVVDPTLVNVLNHKL